MISAGGGVVGGLVATLLQWLLGEVAPGTGLIMVRLGDGGLARAVARMLGW
jgi:hypothetical protein